MQEFITPPNHKGFSAKKLFDENGKIKWGAIAYIEKGGGGPEGNHVNNFMSCHRFNLTCCREITHFPVT